MTTGELFPKPIVTTTGSFPRQIYEEETNQQLSQAIRHALDLQRQAGVDWYVDGQFGNDIVGLFAKRIGLRGRVIRPNPNLRLAREQPRPGKKAY